MGSFCFRVLLLLVHIDWDGRFVASDCDAMGVWFAKLVRDFGFGLK